MWIAVAPTSLARCCLCVAADGRVTSAPVAARRAAAAGAGVVATTGTGGGASAWARPTIPVSTRTRNTAPVAHTAPARIHAHRSHGGAGRCGTCSSLVLDTVHTVDDRSRGDFGSLRRHR